MTGQTEFTKALLDPALPTPDGLVDPEGRPAGKRFDVYRNNVVSSLLDAMETAFPVVQKLVGEEFFRAMAGVYVRAHPPKSPLLMFYGAELPAFLENFEPASHLAYLPDVARLELARRGCYHAKDHTKFDPASFAKIDPDAMDGITIQFAPSASIIASEYPILSIWLYNMVDSTTQIPAQGEQVLLFRPEWDVEMHPITPAEGVFLTAMMAGNTLGQANELATQQSNDFDLSAAIGMMIGTNIIKELES